MSRRLQRAVEAALIFGVLAAASGANAAGIVFNSLSATSNNPGTANLAFLETLASLTNTNTNGMSASVAVAVSQTDFTAPIGSNLGVDIHVTGSISGPSGAANLLSITSCVNANNVGGSCSVVGDTIHQSPDITGSTFTSDVAILISSLAAPFGMTEFFSITLGAGETLTFDATTSVVPTPLPAAVPLLAGGLGALGLFGWRRRRRTAI